jgi:hypothetical protein
MMVTLLGHVSRVSARYRMLAMALYAACAVYAVTMGQLAGFGMPWLLLVSLMALERDHAPTDSNRTFSGADSKGTHSFFELIDVVAGDYA